MIYSLRLMTTVVFLSTVSLGSKKSEEFLTDLYHEFHLTPNPILLHSKEAHIKLGWCSKANKKGKYQTRLLTLLVNAASGEMKRVEYYQEYKRYCGLGSLVLSQTLPRMCITPEDIFDTPAVLNLLYDDGPVSIIVNKVGEKRKNLVFKTSSKHPHSRVDLGILFQIFKSFSEEEDTVWNKTYIKRWKFTWGQWCTEISDGGAGPMGTKALLAALKASPIAPDRRTILRRLQLAKFIREAAEMSC